MNDQGDSTDRGQNGDHRNRSPDLSESGQPHSATTPRSNIRFLTVAQVILDGLRAQGDRALGAALRCAESAA